MPVTLSGTSLTIADVVAVARAHARVDRGPDVEERMRRARAIVERAIENSENVYGLTTGVGVRKRTRVAGDLADFNRRLVLDHRVGQGEPAAEDLVRAHLLLVANGFARGTAGVRVELLDRVLTLLNDGPLPTVRTLGSIGMADLPANADLALSVMDGFPLAAKEGLALLGNDAFSTALATLAFADATRLLRSLDVAAALDLEALGANLSLLDGDPSGSFARLLEGTESSARELQDPLCFRCIPQVHAAARETFWFVGDRVARELNRSQDNPLVLVDEGRIASVGNFDPVGLSAALDFARIALASVLTTAAERGVKLLQAPITGLPEGLAAEAGTAGGGLSEFGVPLQALAAEAKLLAQPVSVETGSTSHHEGIEDRITLAPLSARRLAQQVELGERLAAIELTIAAQAIDLRGRPALGAGTRTAYARVRQVVPMTGPGDPPPQDLEPVRELVLSGELPQSG